MPVSKISKSKMGKVCIIYSIKPENQKINLEEIAEQIKKIENFDTLEIKPFMFGMNQIFVTFILPDKVEKTGTDNIEKKLKNIKGVSSINQEAFTLT